MRADLENKPHGRMPDTADVLVMLLAAVTVSEWHVIRAVGARYRCLVERRRAPSDTDLNAR